MTKRIKVGAFFLGILLAAFLSGNAFASEGQPDDSPSRSTKIVGGTVAPSNSWPSQALLFPGGEYLCGGTLIAPRWVLTAAHCLAVEGVYPGNTRVAIGVKSIGAETSPTRDFFIHPGWLYSEETMNDIALVRLRGPSSRPTTKIISPSEYSLVQEGAPAFIAGWGKTCFEECLVSAQLLQATIEIFNTNRCYEAYLDEFVEGDMLCAGAAGIDSCQGDSGGPLEIAGPSGRILAGIVSWGRGCADPDYPGVYTDIRSFWNWIGRHISHNVQATKRVAFKRAGRVFLTNKSAYPLFPSFRLSNKRDFFLQKNTCQKILAQGQSCFVSIKKTNKKKTRAKLLIQNSARETVAQTALFGRR